MIAIVSTLFLYFILLTLSIYGATKLKLKKNLLKKLGFRETNIVNSVLQGLFYFGILFIIALIIGGVFNYFQQTEDLGKVSEAVKSVNIVNIIIIASVASFVEEIFFRGYLQRKTNILLASFLFSYFHIIYWSLSELIATFFMGMALGISFKRTKNLFVPIFAHFFYNLVIIMLIFLP